MSDNKKYYYLKLKENFFESDELILLESMLDGHLYSNILLKLYLRSLKNEGRLMLKEHIPFNSTMLAQVTRHQVGTIEKAVAIFRDLGLIEVLDNGAIYLTDIQNFIGESSTEADRIRAYRARISAERKGSVQMYDKCTPELELELDIELEKERGGNPAHKKKYLEFVLLKEEEHEKLIKEYGEDITNEYMQRLNDYIGSKGKKYKSHYHTILTWIRKDKGSEKTTKETNKYAEGEDIAKRAGILSF